PRTAFAICWGFLGGSTEIVGTCSECAPYPRSRAARPSPCSLVRGTSTRQPYNGLVSNHDSASRRSTTRPMTTTAGPSTSLPCSARDSRFVTTVDCSVVVPTRVSAAGVFASLPASIRDSLASLSRSSASNSTRVRPSAWADQSTLLSPTSTMLKSLLSLDVNGTPAYAGTAVADDRPGTTSKLMPALAVAAASSGPEQYVNGSPTSRRTTCAPFLACLSTARVRGEGVIGWSWRPTSTICASVVTRFACSGVSITTTSASASSSAARTVSNRASPGPAPTKLMCPAVGFIWLTFSWVSACFGLPVF